MAEDCELRRANGDPGVDCNEEECIFWRVADHLGLPEYEGGCAIQHFKLLEGGSEIVEWLLTVKDRLNDQRQG